MASLTNIRKAMAANLQSIDGLKASPWMLSSPPLPACHIYPGGEIEYDVANARGLDRHNLVVQMLVPFTSDRGSQEKLDAYLAGSGGSSVKEALESDAQLGGACDDLFVRSASGYRRYTLDNGVIALGAEWQVEVIARGN